MFLTITLILNLEGVRRSLGTIEKEIEGVMSKHDKDGSGELEFSEFVAMLMSENRFKFKITEEQRVKSSPQSLQNCVLFLIIG